MTPQSKASIFGRYLGQKFKTSTPEVFCHACEGVLTPMILNAICKKSLEFSSLLLTSLEDITEEHAIELAGIIGFTYKPIDNLKVLIKEVFIDRRPCTFNLHPLNVIAFYSTATSLGYALDQTVIENERRVLYTVAQLVEQGVFTIKNK